MSPVYRAIAWREGLSPSRRFVCDWLVFAVCAFLILGFGLLFAFAQWGPLGEDSFILKPIREVLPSISAWILVFYGYSTWMLSGSLILLLSRGGVLADRRVWRIGAILSLVMGIMGAGCAALLLVAANTDAVGSTLVNSLLAGGAFMGFVPSLGMFLDRNRKPS